MANIEKEEKLFKGLKITFCYSRISVTGGSVIAGFNCIGICFKNPQVQSPTELIMDPFEVGGFREWSDLNS